MYNSQDLVYRKKPLCGLMLVIILATYREVERTRMANPQKVNFNLNTNMVYVRNLVQFKAMGVDVSLQPLVHGLDLS